MSKNIVIKEGDTSKTLNNVKKLQTAQSGGGTCYWVPESEVQLTTKSVNKNGTYKAEDDNYYGYSQFTVSGINSVVGKATKDPSSGGGIITPDGNEHMITIDEETGELIDIPLPARIHCTKQPDNTLYFDGQPIDITGVIVKAYLKDTTKWDENVIWEHEGYEGGVIPINELQYEPKVAKYPETPEGEIDTDLNRPVYANIPTVGDLVSVGTAPHTYIYEITGNPTLFLFPTNSSMVSCTLCWVSDQPFRIEDRRRSDDGTWSTNTEDLFSSSAITYLDNLYYIDTQRTVNNGSTWTTTYQVSNYQPGIDIRTAALMAFVDAKKGKVAYRIPLKIYWNRFGDQKLLEYSF